MATKFYVVSIFILAMILNSSCSSTQSLYEGFTRKQGSLKYIHNARRNTGAPIDTVVVTKPVITDKKFTYLSEVKKVKAYVVPVIVYNEWRSVHEYWIGSSVIVEDIPTFIQSSFTEESKRSSSFAVDTTLLSTNHLTLEISIDTIGAGGPYEDNGFLYFFLFLYGYSVSEQAGPGVAYSNFHYRLRRGDETLLEGNATDSREVENLVHIQRSTNALRSYYTTALVEALSQTFKTNIETIIKDINNFLKFKKSG